MQEFERLELEVAKTHHPHESPVSINEEEAAEMVASATGSLNSLAEFENLEREVLGELIFDKECGFIKAVLIF